MQVHSREGKSAMVREGNRNKCSTIYRVHDAIQLGGRNGVERERNETRERYARGI